MSNSKKRKKSELPVFIGIDMADIQQRLMKLSSIAERLIFLDRVIGQTAIEKGLSMWDADCYSCVQQFRSKWAWEGIFDAVHGENNVNRAINSDGYKFGQEHYRNYIELKRLREAVEKGKQLSSNEPNTESLLIKPLTDQHYQALTDLANRLKLFSPSIDKNTMQTLLTGQLQDPLKVSNNIILSCFFSQLSPDFISDKWQNIIGKLKCLRGKRGAHITSTSLAKSLTTMDRQSDYYKEIQRVVGSMK